MVAVSVLLLTKDGLPDLQRLLPALYLQSYIASVEVIAVDSGSTDGTVQLLQGYPLRIERIPADAFHHARTRNLAASFAQSDILVFLSQDAVPTSGNWLATMVRNFDDPKVGAVYGRQIAKPGSGIERQDTLEIVYGTRRVIKDPSHRNGLGYRFYHFSDANAAIRRDVWQATRFPENMKVFEDMGIAKRILDRGWKIVYEPEAAVYHSHDHSTVGLFKRYFDIGCTLTHLGIWDTPGTRKSLWQDGWKMLKRKLTKPRDTTIKRVPGGGIQQDIAKTAGLFLGINQACLPYVVKRHLSAFRIFE